MIFLSFRGFTLILFIPAIEAISLLELKKVRLVLNKIPGVLARLVPFIAIAYSFGIFSYGKDANESAVVPTHIKNLFTIPLSPDFFAELVRIVGRIVAPQAFIGKTFKIVMTQEHYFVIGFLFLLASFITAFIVYKKNQIEYFKGILFFMAIMIGGFAGNLLLLLTFDSNGPINRYLNLSFIGYSGLLSLLIYLLSKRVSKRFNVKSSFIYAPLIMVIVLIFVSLSVDYEKEILRERSTPSKNFFRDLFEYVPKISEKTLFYFDNADYHPTLARFGYIMVGAFLPREAVLAVHYKTTLDKIEIKNTFGDLEKELIKNPSQKFYTFYYDQYGLHNTTEEVSNLLEKGGEKILLHGEKVNSDLFKSEIELNSNITSIAPYSLNFSLRINPANYSAFSLPYTELLPKDKVLKKYKNVNKKRIFSYLLSRKNYYERTSLNVSGSHVSGMRPAELLIDERVDTYWIADENSYSTGVMPWIEMDLGEEKNIGKLLWVNETPQREPKNFKVLVSSEKSKWREVKILSRKKFQEEKIITVLSLEPQNARFLRLEIKDTIGKITPGLAELEIIEYIYNNVDLQLARRIKTNPFEYIKDQADLTSTYDYLKNDSVLSVKTLTNKENTVSDTYNLTVPVIFDGQFHDYSITAPPRGIKLQKIIFKLPYPAEMSASDISVEYLPLRNIRY